MASLATRPASRSNGAASTSIAAVDGAARLELVHRLLHAGAVERVHPVLDAARRLAGRALVGGGASDAADRNACGIYVANVVAELAAEGELDEADLALAVRTLAETRGEPLEAAAFDVHQRAGSCPALLELPPLVAVEIQLRLLLLLGVASEVSLWRREAGRPDLLLTVGAETPSRRVRATAKSTLAGRGSLSLVGAHSLRAAPVRRFGAPYAALVARVVGSGSGSAQAYVETTAVALAAVVERELLLERNAARERAIVSAGEKRLMAIGFDLHDGPVQDVLALGAEVRHLRDQVYPFVLESHRELAYGRFEDVLGRLIELDRSLRDVAHSLESKSVVSRPLAEILHRDIDAFADRSGIEVVLDVKGDPESLTAAQRIAVFRAIQESLSNVREHSGATRVEIAVRSRRASVDVRVTDNGHGFEVGRALARAAQRGRLGIVGIGERVRMLGGTFELDSAPGGPTTLSFSLPRVTPNR